MARKAPTPVEKPTAKSIVRKAVVTKNPTSVKFEHAPFYNLATIRKNVLTLITRTAGDSKKVDAVRETLETALKFLDVRSKHEATVRKGMIASLEAAAAARVKSAAEHERAAIETQLKDAEAQAEKAKAILAELDGDKEAAE